MSYRACIVLGSLLLLDACAAAPLEQQIVADSAAALGGAERLQAVRTLVQEGEGVHYYLGQDGTAERVGADVQSFGLPPDDRRG